MTIEQWAAQSCKVGAKEINSLDLASAMQELHGWQTEPNGAISKTYRFKNYYEATAFLSATFIISHKQDHHPDVVLTYNTVTFKYITHDVGGVTTNDIICAAKLEMLHKISG